MPTQRKNPGLLLRNAGIFNPVLVQAVGLCPVIAMATTLKGAVLLAAVSALIITLSELVASLFFKAIPRWVRIGLYIIIGGALIAPVMLLLEKTDAELFGSLGIYLPVMAVNSLIVLRCERFAVKISPVSAVLDGLTASVGYAAVLIFIGAVREILGSGSIWGFKFFKGPTLSGLLLPFGGFLMLGYAASVLRAFISVYWPKYLDKKQPKPKDKKKAAPKKPRPVPTSAVLPDLAADDSPFSLEEISGELPEQEENITEQEPEHIAEAAPKSEPIIIVEPEHIQAPQPVKIVEPVIEKVVEETAQEIAPEPQVKTTQEIAPEPLQKAEPIADLTLDDVFETETKNEEKQTEILVDDDELEKLMNRSTDEVIGSKKKEESEE